MPSSAGRRSRGNPRSDSVSPSDHRSVKFSGDLGVDDDIFRDGKRPVTAPGSRRKKEEPKDPLNNTFTAPSSKGSFNLILSGSTVFNRLICLPNLKNKNVCFQKVET